MALRLDRWMVENGFAGTTEKAKAMIMAGDVLIDGQRVDKAGYLVAPAARVEVRARPRYVSRGGLKLEAALKRFGVRIAGAVCADIGTSTGGFTDCLLQHGALRVHAID